ncbi:hypothetical protein QFC21_006418 [Naganishia friedmannii]|uniref:Uncharacterized protein n=1 Tax=Naganishia friedmannii TaxID=89922 RepID=A0ACC2V2S3_9TREE|nr:hypothetical protein QFC21_006418 [Naganishia friedmannii]
MPQQERQPLLPSSNRDVPAPHSAAAPVAKRDKGVLQSSLDIVFSYSRSQQLFAASHLPSAPSFIDDPADDSYFYNEADEDDEGEEGESEDGDVEAEESMIRETTEDYEDLEEDLPPELRRGRQGTDQRTHLASGTTSTTTSGDGVGKNRSALVGGRRRKDLANDTTNDPEHGFFGQTDHSPSPSRGPSPTRAGAGQMVGEGPGREALHYRQSRNYGTAAATGQQHKAPGAATRWASSRTITSANAFDVSTLGGGGATTTDNNNNKDDQSFISNDNDTSFATTTDGDDSAAEAEEEEPEEGLAKRKRSVVSFRGDTDFGGGFTSLSATPGGGGARRRRSNVLNASTAGETFTPLAPTSPNAHAQAHAHASQLSPLSSRVLSSPSGLRVASGFAGSTAAARRGSIAGRRMSVSVKSIHGHQVELGRSTSGQTMFNAIAVLVGIGVLSEPLAFRYAGWIGGTLLLLAFGVVTNYTAKLLAKLILEDPGCQGYSDLGIKAFGWKARWFVDTLFCLELFALSIAWIVLLGDSLHAVLGRFSTDTYKIIGFFIVVPTTLLPLHLLSIPSLISLFSSFLLILILLIDGFSKSAAPGSIIHPVKTSLGPDMENYNFLGGLGLLIAGFGGHAIIPSLALDMKSPHKFNKVCDWAFGIASVIFMITGTAGYLMFGDKVTDEITKDLMKDEYGFSKTLNQVATWMIVINPIAKFALCTRPLNLTVEALFGLNPMPHGDPHKPALTEANKPLLEGEPPSTARERERDLGSQFTITTTGAFAPTPSASTPPSVALAEKRKTAGRLVARVGVTAACVAVAILLPEFERLMAFLGSFTTFFICVLLPLMFYTAIVPKEERGRTRDIIHLIIFVISSTMMVCGTAWAFVSE